MKNPTGGPPISIPVDATGAMLDNRTILIRRDLPPAEFIATLRHEVNHALREVGAPGSFQHYQAEFDAFWVDGSFDHIRDVDARAEAIRDYVMVAYPEFVAGMADPTFVEQVADYRRPTGNDLNSPVWAELAGTRPGKELRALEALERATPAERQALRESLSFVQLLNEELKGADLAMARTLLND